MIKQECCNECSMGAAINEPWCNNAICPCHRPELAEKDCSDHYIAGHHRGINALGCKLSPSAESDAPTSEWEEEFDTKYGQVALYFHADGADIPYANEIKSFIRSLLQKKAVKARDSGVRLAATYEKAGFALGCQAAYGDVLKVAAELRKGSVGGFGGYVPYPDLKAIISKKVKN